MQRKGKQFVYPVDDGRKAEKLGTASFKALPKTPVSHTWEVGQTVVYVQCTAAGWMPTSLLGTIAAIVKDGRQTKARIVWHSETKVKLTLICNPRKIEAYSQPMTPAP